MWIDFSAHDYVKTLQDLSLGFLKRTYFIKSNEMATRDEPLKDVVGGLLISVTRCGPFFGIYEFPVYSFDGSSRVAILTDFQK